ncbi:MAG: transcriptional regulator [Microbacterium sp.]|nr:transcriptional regulator [Microbacterium sp.]
MTLVSRQARLFETFAKLADTLVADYDVVDLLQTLVDSCRDLLDATDAGILLANSSGQLELIASTSEAAHLVETIQLAAQAGPCVECYRSSRVVSVPDLTEGPEEWDQFRRFALDNDFAAIDAIPMRLRDVTIGTLNLLRATPGPADPDDLAAAQAFADVATIGILHERALNDTQSLARQLQSALDSRVMIEQAKGVVSFTAQVPVAEAFQLIRTYARGRGLRLGDVAARIVSRELQIEPGAV